MIIQNLDENGYCRDCGEMELWCGCHMAEIEMELAEIARAKRSTRARKGAATRAANKAKLAACRCTECGEFTLWCGCEVEALAAAPVQAPTVYQGRGLAALLASGALLETNNDGLVVVPVELDTLKKALESYLSNQNVILAELYTRFKAFRDKYFPGMADIVISIEPMNNKVLAHYQPKNGLSIPHVITFNSAFIALNYEDKNPVELDRDIVGHVLLHEMIHHFQCVEGEEFKNQQAAHGRSFRKEAKRLGVEGAGRLMKCPYPVKMPESARAAKPKDDKDPGTGEDDNDIGQECKRPHLDINMLAAIQKLAKDLKNRRFGYEVFCDKLNDLWAGGAGEDNTGGTED